MFGFRLESKTDQPKLGLGFVGNSFIHYFEI
jgi:hypothetical protein